MQQAEIDFVCIEKRIIVYFWVIINYKTELKKNAFEPFVEQP